MIKPRFLCILETNHMPELDSVITAIKERILIVDFPVTFTDLMPGEEPTLIRRQCDKGLKARLQGPMAGNFLRWLVEGAMRWYATKDLKRMAPPEVKEVTKQYFDEQDTLMQFLTERCEVSPVLKVSASDLVEAYNDWTSGNGKQMDAKKMAGPMRHKGFIKKPVRLPKNPSTVQGYEGIGLRPAPFRLPPTDYLM